MLTDADREEIVRRLSHCKLDINLILKIGN